MELAGQIILTLLMLLLSAFFSGSEIAFVSASKLKIELKSKQGTSKGNILSKFVKRTPRVITTILVGNNFALVIYGIYFAKLLEGPLTTLPFLNEDSVFISLLVQTIISTTVILIFGEYLPKALFRLNPDMMIDRAAYPLNIFYVVFGPVVTVINGLSKFLLKNVFRLNYEEEDLEFSKKDLDVFIRDTLIAGSGEDGEASAEIDTEMFINAMDFNNIRARECMVPRTEIHAIDVEEGLDALFSKFFETELSKIIIYRENLDQVIGYVHSSSLFTNPSKISEVITPVLMVPESMPGNVLLSEFTANRKSIAIVVDEFGGTEGLVTMEDLVEEVFGEIDDEHDEETVELLERQLEENIWLFSARLEVDDINKDHELELPEGEYNTLGGLVMHFAERIPAIDEEVLLENYRITVMDGSENKLNTVKVERLDPISEN